MNESAIMRGTKVRSGYNRGNPTLGELEALLAVIDVGDTLSAAHELGISVPTVRRQLANLYLRIGATDRTDAVRIMWPVIGDHVTLFGRRPGDLIVRRLDRRLGIDRRRTSAVAAAMMLVAILSACSSTPAQTMQVPATPTPPPATVRPSAVPSRDPAIQPSPAPSPAHIPGGRWYVVNQLAWPPTDTYQFWLSWCPRQPQSWHDEILASCSTPEVVDSDQTEWFQIDIGQPWPHERPAP